MPHTTRQRQRRRRKEKKKKKNEHGGSPEREINSEGAPMPHITRQLTAKRRKKKKKKKKKRELTQREPPCHTSRGNEKWNRRRVEEE